MIRSALMRRAISLLALALGVLLLSSGPASATLWWSQPFSRQVAQPGDQDVDPWHVHHVYELQWRLRRLGLYTIRPTGYYGSQTRRAVKQFQREAGLPVTGTMDRPSWRKLIPRSTRGRAHVPAVCSSAGWHVCYDRNWHQLTLFHRGQVINSWMVRGGAYDTQTRPGNFTVYARVIDEVSIDYDNSPMPYAQYFDGGEAIHGSRMMVDPYVGHSHGCINMYVKDARQLWYLTEGHRLHVHVYGAWD